jgi:hypothetical protein
MFEVDGGMLRVRDKAAVRSEAGVKAAACSEARDEAAACSGVIIEDGRWRRCSGVWGDRSVSARRFQKIAKCCKRERGAWNFRACAPNARHTRITCVSLFLVWEMRIIQACLAFH